MATIEPRVVADEYYSAKDIDRLFAALEKRIQAREVLRIEQAAEFLGVSRKTLDNLCRAGMPYHRLDGLGTKLFLRSELIDYIKRH